MTTLNESEIYLKTKKFFKDNGWKIIGGQPPKGSDHLPVIEIKNTVGEIKGSKEVYKPDLICLNKNLLLIVELKPKYNHNDYEKLLSILKSKERLNNLYFELIQRGLLSKSYLTSNKISISGCLGFQGPYPKNITVWVLNYDLNSPKLIKPKELSESYVRMEK